MRTTQLQVLTTVSLIAGTWAVPVAASAVGSDSGPGSAQDVNASIVWVDVEFPAAVEVPWDDGTASTRTTEVLSLCTGFFVSDEGEIATAGHCVEADGQTEVAAIAQVVEELAQEGYDVTGLDPKALDWSVEFGGPTAYVGQPSGIPDGIFSGQDTMTAQIVDYQSFATGDNALLRVADLDGTPGLPIAEDAPETGEQVTSVGFPGSVSDVSDVQRQLPSYKFGTVSSRQYTEQGVPNTEIDAAVSGGMSGGPTLSTEGAVVGVNSFRIRGESQPFNFVTDTETLRDFLTRNGVELAATDPERGAEPAGSPANGDTRPGDATVEGTDTAGATGTPTTDASTATGTVAPAALEGQPLTPAAGEDGTSPLVWASVGLLGLLLLAGGAVAGRYLARPRRSS